MTIYLVECLYDYCEADVQFAFVSLQKAEKKVEEINSVYHEFNKVTITSLSLDTTPDNAHNDVNDQE